jgi:hypothetical protein
MSARGVSPRAPLASPRQTPKLTSDETEKLVQKLYGDAVAHRKLAIEKLDKKFYPVAKPLTVDQAKIDESVERQCTKQVELRKKRELDAQKLQARPQSPKTMSETEVEESVRRLYNDSVRIRSEQRKRLESKFTFHNKAAEEARGKRHTKEELQNAALRLSVPVRRNYTADEINAMCGFKTGTSGGSARGTSAGAAES